MRHIASHETEGAVHVKGEPVTEEMLEDNYVVVEVIQDGNEEQYEDEGSDIELEDEFQEEIIEDGDYTLTESEFYWFHQYLLYLNRYRMYWFHPWKIIKISKYFLYS